MAITGTQFNVAYLNDRNVLRHRANLAGKSWFLDGQFDYLRIENFFMPIGAALQFVLDTTFQIFSAVAGEFVLLDTRNDATNKGALISINPEQTKLTIATFSSFSSFFTLEFYNLPFKVNKTHSIVVEWLGVQNEENYVIYFDGVRLSNGINPFGSTSLASSLPYPFDVANGLNTIHIGRKMQFGNNQISSIPLKLKEWKLYDGNYTPEEARRAFNTKGDVPFSVPLIELSTDKVNGQTITDNAGVFPIVITQFGGNNYTQFIN